MAIKLVLTINAFLLFMPLYLLEGTSIDSLDKNCNIHIEYFGLRPFMEQRLVLECNKTKFTVVHPNNLIDHVNITTKAMALEYVRYFTTKPYYEYFDLSGMLEILPSDKSNIGINVVNKDIFYKKMADPIVEEVLCTAPSCLDTG